MPQRSGLTHTEGGSQQVPQSSVSFNPHQSTASAKSNLPGLGGLGGPEGRKGLMQDWPSGLGVGFPLIELVRTKGPVKRQGKDRRRLWIQEPGTGKKRGHVENSQRGRWSTKANDLSSTGSQVPQDPGRTPAPAKDSHQHRGLCPSLLTPCLGGWGLGAPRKEGMSLLSISLPSQAVGSSVPTDPVWPSRPSSLAGPRH